MTEEYELPEIKKRESAIPSHRVGESGAEVVNDGAVNTWAYAATISVGFAHDTISSRAVILVRDRLGTKKHTHTIGVISLHEFGDPARSSRVLNSFQHPHQSTLPSITASNPEPSFADPTLDCVQPDCTDILQYKICFFSSIHCVLVFHHDWHLGSMDRRFTLESQTDLNLLIRRLD
ncbi:hypothetical protein NLI96_g10474 [Meripilus lineatus]|uniref:Uncharacterized protein n=1 Tax=Meripilus lineatus TaxID=2056292 RepID=A0AAD5UV66_9APHY|nr:hypothetical protein NLI96_g10474 [Physisporinus lineatus]